MKSITCLLTLLLVALVSAAVRALDDSVIIPTDLREECLKKDDGANVVAAIEQFCKNTKIVCDLRKHILAICRHAKQSVTDQNTLSRSSRALSRAKVVAAVPKAILLTSGSLASARLLSGCRSTTATSSFTTCAGRGTIAGRMRRVMGGRSARTG
jgi:hypothetical protein